jgi:hypothetical protein
LLLSLTIIFLGSPQTLLNQPDLTFWRLNPAFRFLLKGMQNVETLSKSHGVDRSKGVAIVILYNLENPCAFEAFERLGIPTFHPF